jgi:carbonic anhydrase
LRHADSAKVINESRTHLSPAHKLNAMVRENVAAQLSNLMTHPSVRLARQQRELNLHGWVYDIESGTVEALDGRSNHFVSLNEYPDTCAYRASPATAAA